MIGNLDRNFDSLNDLMARLEAAPPVKVTQLAQIPSAGGAYVLTERGRAVYVGVSNSLRKRMRQETSGRPDQSALAFKLARERTRRKYEDPQMRSRKELMDIPQFAEVMNTTTERVKNMEAKCVVIKEMSQRNLFDLFAALSLSAPHNDIIETYF